MMLFLIVAVTNRVLDLRRTLATPYWGEAIARKDIIGSEMPLMQFLKRLVSIGGSVVSQPTRNQPVPDVTPIDVERIVRREFQDDEFISVMAVLNEFGTEKLGRGAARVQLAALKLANGSVEQLRSNIESAKLDDRDILASAEYPEYHKKGLWLRELPADEELRIIDNDWRQYQAWLRK